MLECCYTISKDQLKNDIYTGYTYICIYCSRASKYKHQVVIKLKEEIDSDTITLGKFITSLSTINISFRQKIINNNKKGKCVLDQMDLIDI